MTHITHPLRSRLLIAHTLWMAALLVSACAANPKVAADEPLSRGPNMALVLLHISVRLDGQSLTCVDPNQSDEEGPQLAFDMERGDASSFEFFLDATGTVGLALAPGRYRIQSLSEIRIDGVASPSMLVLPEPLTFDVPARASVVYGGHWRLSLVSQRDATTASHDPAALRVEYSRAYNCEASDMARARAQFNKLNWSKIEVAPGVMTREGCPE